MQGGPRGGTPGQSYPNRTDIAAQPSLPARAATGQTYGKAQSQLEAQRAVPMAPPRVTLPSAVPSPAPAAGPGVGASPSPMPGPPPQNMPPGMFGDHERPTERPGEPVTAGAAMGPGPGQEALSPAMGALGQQNSVSAVLQRAAQATNSPVLQKMAANAQAAGQ
jgi:hypothetical protein